MPRRECAICRVRHHTNKFLDFCDCAKANPVCFQCMKKWASSSFSNGGIRCPTCNSQLKVEPMEDPLRTFYISTSCYLKAVSISSATLIFPAALFMFTGYKLLGSFSPKLLFASTLLGLLTSFLSAGISRDVGDVVFDNWQWMKTSVFISILCAIVWMCFHFFVSHTIMMILSVISFLALVAFSLFVSHRLMKAFEVRTPRTFVVKSKQENEGFILETRYPTENFQ